MSDNELTERDFEKFYELWVGILFDVIQGVHTQFPTWSADKQKAMMMLIIRTLAIEIGVIDDDDAGKADEDTSTRQ